MGHYVERPSALPRNLGRVEERGHPSLPSFGAPLNLSLSRLHGTCSAVHDRIYDAGASLTPG